MKEYTKMNNENENLQQYVNVERSKWIEKEQELNKKINTKKKSIRGMIITFSIITLVLLGGYIPYLMKEQSLVNSDWLEVFIYDENGLRGFTINTVENKSVIFITGDFEQLEVYAFSRCNKMISFSKINIILEDILTGVYTGFSDPSFSLFYKTQCIEKVQSVNIEIVKC